MKKYRVECNYGSKYFECSAEAMIYFKKCKDRFCNAEIWILEYCFNKKLGRYSANQDLLDYHSCSFPKK